MIILRIILSKYYIKLSLSMSLQIEAEESFTIFRQELQLFSKNKDTYDLDSFTRNVFFLHIHNIALNLPEWFINLTKSKETNIIDIYDFCNSFINSLFLSFLDSYKQSILKLKDEQSIKNEYIELNNYCVYGLLLFNATFLINQSVEKNMNYIVQSKDIIVKQSISKVCKTIEEEIITNMKAILLYLKELQIQSPLEYDDMICEQLKIDEEFNLLVDSTINK
jgi:hypothetical protein